VEGNSGAEEFFKHLKGARPFCLVRSDAPGAGGHLLALTAVTSYVRSWGGVLCEEMSLGLAFLRGGASAGAVRGMNEERTSEGRRSPKQREPPRGAVLRRIAEEIVEVKSLVPV